VLFKAPASLGELGRINCGLFYGYSQVGKFITVYPQFDDEAVFLAEQLHRLTQRISAPSIPFDCRYERDSCVFYRYGAFETLEIVYPDGSRMAAMRDREGKLIADRRYSADAPPEWVTNPFPSKPAASTRTETPLNSTYLGFEALVQRGKGGVYKALDTSGQTPRFCIIKEGRKNGEVNWDRRDGRWRIKHEKKVLKCLREHGVPVPEVYDSFDLNQHHYLITEFIPGESLQAALERRNRRYSVQQAVRYSLELATLIDRVHSCGWTWRDCKPNNILLTPNGLRLLDFEGACPISKNDPVSWGTPPFVPPEWEVDGSVRSGVYDDKYALGAVIYLLLYGKPPTVPPAVESKRDRESVPRELQEVVSRLLSSDPATRPDIGIVISFLRQALGSSVAQ
jgi:tRNA A-37 threonylcarbamoyl transferase component Bud32